jgi:translation initiation factor 5B
MAPKKKGGNKKAADNWEDELGESPDPIAQATHDAKEEDAAGDNAEDDAGAGGGGLLAALKKNRGQKKKKGKVVEDFVEGEDPTADGEPAPEPVNLAAKAPQEGTFDDEEDVFGQPVKKGKGGKGGKGGKQQEVNDDEDDDEDDGSGRMKTKKEKEKEKREREKARKKEQVCYFMLFDDVERRVLMDHDRQPRRKLLHQHRQRRRSLRRLLRRLK